MFSLEYGVQLSRRACRAGPALLLVLWVASCAAKPPNHAADALMHPQPDPENVPRDIGVLLQGGLTPGPPRTVETASTTAESSSTQGAPQMVEDKPVERYSIMTISFYRVEMPFIIGMWIFCASLAKIGRFVCRLFVGTVLTWFDNPKYPFHNFKT